MRWRSVVAKPGLLASASLRAHLLLGSNLNAGFLSQISPFHSLGRNFFFLGCSMAKSSPGHCVGNHHRLDELHHTSSSDVCRSSIRSGHGLSALYAAVDLAALCIGVGREERYRRTGTGTGTGTGTTDKTQAGVGYESLFSL